MANINTLQVLTQIMQMSEADRNALVQLLTGGVSAPAPTQVSAPIAQTAPQSAPVQQVVSSRSDDTVVEVVLSHDAKGVEFFIDRSKDKDAFPVMGGVREVLKAEGLKIEWDKSFEGVRTYHDDRNGHVYGAHKPGAYALVDEKSGKRLSKAKVAEWVKANPMVVLTAESKDAYKAAKADKQAKKLERERKILAKYGYTM